MLFLDDPACRTSLSGTSSSEETVSGHKQEANAKQKRDCDRSHYTHLFLSE